MRTVIFLIASLISANALAQEEIATEDLEKKALAKTDEAKKTPDGWKATAKVGFTGSLNNNTRFVGAEDGTTLQLGGVLGVTADLKSGQSSWENALDLTLAGSKTPQISKFVKSSDALELRSTYFYALESTPWFGGFGGLKLGTQMLPTNAVRSEDYTVIRQDVLGVAQAPRPGETPRPAQLNISVTGAFEPLVLRQSLGVFANPYEGDDFMFKAKLGAAAQEIIVGDGYAIVGEDAAANTITLKQLQSTFQFGAELGLLSGGIIVKDTLTWKAEANLFQPFVTTGDTELGTLELLNVELTAGLSVKLAKWLSLDYQLTVKRVPLILDDWQLQNLLVLSAGFDLI